MTMRKAMTKSIMKSMRNAMRKVKSVTKSVTKSVRKVTRKVARKVKTRRAKRRTMKGGNYETSITSKAVELIPTLKEDSKDLSVSVPGFGTISMEEYHEYMEDLDRNGSAQM